MRLFFFTPVLPRPSVFARLAFKATTLVLLALVLLVLPSKSAQNEKTSMGLMLGVNGFTYPYYDLAWVFAKQDTWGRTTIVKGYGGLSAGMELRLQGRTIWGPKIGYTINKFVSFGASLIYYTDFNAGTARFRPEIGISTAGIRVVYGYNTTLNNYDFLNVNLHNVGLTWYIPLTVEK